MLDNIDNKDTLHPIQEEDDAREEEQEKAESCAVDNDADENEREENEEDEKCQFPDTQIKIDLSGPK